jgi:hypothetical protein
MTDPHQPIHVYEATLSYVDALWFEQVPAEMRGWKLWGFFIWLGSAGAMLALLPEEWGLTSMPWFPVVGLALVAVNYGLVIVWMNVTGRIRARRRFPKPVRLRVEEWGDHFAIEVDGKMSHMAYETINRVFTGQQHFFAVSGKDVLIIPRHAFADPDDPDALVTMIADYGKEP